MRLRRTHIRPLRQRPRQEILINHLPDLVIQQRGPEDEIRPYAPRLRLDPYVRHAGQVRRRHGQHDEVLGRRLRHGVCRHGDELVALFALGEDVEAVFGGAGANGEGAGGGFAVEGADQVGDDGGAVVVEGLAGAETFDVGEVFGRAGRYDFVAGGDGELDRVAADARGAAPD